MTLPPDDAGRDEVLQYLRTFIIWKSALAFTWACELVEPIAINCVGVSRKERDACRARIDRVLPPLMTSRFGQSASAGRLVSELKDAPHVWGSPAIG